MSRPFQLLVLLALVAAGVFASCDLRGGTLVEVLPPLKLSETGLYADLAARTTSSEVLAYSPQYPLWSDGARKQRWIQVPAGSAIDASRPESWRFPVGTKLWKEFAFERPIETRFMQLGADGRWTFATYVWNADGSDAVLAPESGIRAACESELGTRYDVPALSDCRACHEAGPDAVLGFTALQLSPDRDPLAPHAETPPPGAVDLPALVARDLVRGLPSELLEHPPRVVARSPRERAALGYLQANCASCHDPAGKLASLGLSLRAPLGPGGAGVLATALDEPARFRFPGEAAEPALRLVASQPARSALFRRVASRDPFVQMPPLGTHAPDAEAIALLEAWIREDLADASTPTSASTLIAQSNASNPTNASE